MKHRWDELNGKYHANLLIKLTINPSNSNICSHINIRQLKFEDKIEHFVHNNETFDISFKPHCHFT